MKQHLPHLLGTEDVMGQVLSQGGVVKTTLTMDQVRMIVQKTVDRSGIGVVVENGEADLRTLLPGQRSQVERMMRFTERP